MLQNCIPPLLRSASGPSSRPHTRLSFKNVGNMVMRLLVSMKASAEIPFSQVMEPKREEKTAKVVSKASFVCDVCAMTKQFSMSGNSYTSNDVGLGGKE